MVKRPTNKTEYVLKPCNGTISIKFSKVPINLPTGHLYKVIKYVPGWETNPNEDILIGWMGLELAIKKFGDDKIWNCGSSTICPVCFDYQVLGIKKMVMAGETSLHKFLEQYKNLLGDDIDRYVRSADR